MSTQKRQHIQIKGAKERLIFILSEECSFDDIVIELEDILENSHKNILKGPLTKVTLKIGYRSLSENQLETLKKILSNQSNLIIDSIDSELEKIDKKLSSQANIVKGRIRSGQEYCYDGNVLFIGDVHPGGKITAKGDIYIIGMLKGIAHAGASGNNNSIIVASIMEPLQLIIGDVLSNSVDTEMNQNIIAHLKEGQIFLKKY